MFVTFHFSPSQVFEAEKIVAKSGLFHKYCLSCNECKCNLDASSFFNGTDGEVITTTCTIVAVAEGGKNYFTCEYLRYELASAWMR